MSKKVSGKPGAAQHGHIHLARTPTFPAPRTCCRQSCTRAFSDEFPLELGEAGEDAKDKPTIGGGCVNLGSCARQDAQTNAAFAQLINRCHEMLEIAPEAIQFPDNQRISRLKRFHASIKTRSMILSPGRLVFIDALGIDTGFNQRITLQIKDLAPVRLRYTCIADEHGNSPRQNRQDAPCNLTMISATVFLVMLTALCDRRRDHKENVRFSGAGRKNLRRVKSDQVAFNHNSMVIQALYLTP